MTRQKYKIGVVAALVVGACSLTYYFHVFLTRGTFIAHVFYIPIVLASVWWRRKGLIVAAFSSAFLIVSHVLLRPDVAVINDYSRAVMFLVISFVVGKLSERIAKDKDELESANEKLQASEQEIREMEEDWRQSFNSLEDVMILIDRDFTIEKINANGLKLLGKSHADVVGKKCYEVLHGLSAPTEGCPLKKSLKTGRVESIDRFEKDFGGHFSIKVSPVFDEKGRIIKFVDLMRDITERKRAEEERQAAYEQLQASEQQLKAANQQLRTEVAERRQVEEVLVKSEDRFRQLLDNMSSGVAVYEARDDGQDFVFVDFNHAGERINDIKREDLIGKSVLEVFPGVKDFGLFDVFQEVWRTGEPEHYPVSFYEDERIAGWRENYVYKLPSGEIVAVYDDITERKQAEEQLWRTRAELEHVSRLITAGEMASGIAHELNQPLCAILNYANALLRAIKGGRIKEDTLTVALEDIASQTNRAGEIIRRLRALVKKRGPRRSSVNINEIVEEVIKLEQAEALEHGVVINTELADDMQLVIADNIQLQQVILNLVRNAFEAMAETPRENRRLTIRTTAVEGGRIQVAVCDNGKGLSEDTAERMFDSFFSTRDDGLGVGLSLSRSIIQALGGKIWAEPNADCGATVRFGLPVEGA
ncbi:MAG: PAS domain S-box protein [Phycisphaerae bacterium]|nr:PAS domain S-box protein [Phycisphaerae bacterium]